MIIELFHMLIPFMPNGNVELMYKNIVFMMLLILAKVIDREFYEFLSMSFMHLILFLPNGDIELMYKKIVLFYICPTVI
jgi:hypothetical protein